MARFELTRARRIIVGLRRQAQKMEDAAHDARSRSAPDPVGPAVG
jgi:hypothetical protein